MKRKSLPFVTSESWRTGRPKYKSILSDMIDTATAGPGDEEDDGE